MFFCSRFHTRQWIFLFIHFVALASLASSTTVNVTVDDEQGDSRTGAQPTYAPSDGWSQGATCSGCEVKADPALAFDNTWHDSTVHLGDQPHTITIQFTGILSFNKLPLGVAQ